MKDVQEVVLKEILTPTLPALPALSTGGAERTALLAGLLFIEGATSGWGSRELVQWFINYGSVLGRVEPPAIVNDSTVGTIALAPGARLVGERVASLADLPKLLAMARWKAIVSLRGLLAGDDRFLQAAIFSGRARRERGEKGALWVARPRETDLLSDVVLSLFAVDILSYRDFYEESLCICDICGRVSFNPAITTKMGCSDHIPGDAISSGVCHRAPEGRLGRRTP